MISLALARHRYGLGPEAAKEVLDNVHIDWSESTWGEIDEAVIEEATQQGHNIGIRTLTDLNGRIIRLD